MSIKFHAFTFDCANPQPLAEFWSQVIGQPIAQNYGQVIAIAPAAGNPLMVFQQIDEVPTQRNRAHPDFATVDLDAETQRLLGLGATLIEQFELPGLRYTSFADPDGNKFDVMHQSE